MPGVDRYTAMMLHCNGTNGSSVFTDSSTNVLTFTTSGTATITTSNFKFATGSGMFDGASNTSTPDSAVLTLGSNDFTIDWQMLTSGSSAGAARFPWGQGNTTATAGFTVFSRQNTSDNTITFFVSSDGITLSTLVSTIAISTSAFTHCAFVRSGSTMMAFIGGVQTGGTLTYTGAVNDSSNIFALGALGEVVSSANRYIGLLDEFRYTVGVARWTADFTPSGVQYDEWMTEYGIGNISGKLVKVNVIGY